MGSCLSFDTFITCTRRASQLFELACARDLEGVVGKFAQGTYQSDGTATSWVKFKHAGYSQIEGRAELFEQCRSPETRPVPRAALIYDVFGNSKTALKASWGRFATNPAALIAALANPIDVVTRKYVWDTSYLTADPAVAATRITPAYVATLRPIFGGAQLTPTTVDPGLKDWYTDEYTFGAEQEIAGDLRAHVTVVRKRQEDTFGRYDRLRTLSSYTPVQALDPGPDGIVRSADDRTLTVWETRLPADRTDFYLTNKPIGDTYDTVEFGVTKRMSDHWQLTSGVDWTKRNLSSEFSQDPNTMFWNSKNTQTTGWTFKASGSYVFNHDYDGWLLGGAA